MDVAGKVHVNKKDSPVLMAFVGNMNCYENSLKRFMQMHRHAMKLFDGYSNNCTEEALERYENVGRVTKFCCCFI